MTDHAFYKPRLGAVLAEAVAGKSIGRTLTNLFWRGTPEMSGTILDIGGGGGRGSHYRFLPIASGAVIKTADIISRPGTDFVLDITKEKVPLPDSSVDHIFLFNILEHLSAHEAPLKEIKRLLRPGGTLIGSIPFLVNVHPDPSDFVRLTDEALTALFTQNGFTVRAVVPIGRGPFLAGYEQLDSLIPHFLHALFLPVVWGLDGLLQTLKPKRDFRRQFPLAYNFVVEKMVI